VIAICVQTLDSGKARFVNATVIRPSSGHFMAVERAKWLCSLTASLLFLEQKLGLLNLTLAQIHEEENEQKADQTESKQKVEGRAIVVRRACINDCR
jgi:hypothetical protein